jgi:lysine 2,3-aminomutase
MDEALEREFEPPSAAGPAASTSLATTGSHLKLHKRLHQPTLLPPRSASFLHQFYPQAGPDQWNDWHWQVANRISDLRRLARILSLSAEESGALLQSGELLPFAVTPYYAGLLVDRPSHPLRRSVVPTMAELTISEGEEGDPLGEEHDSPLPGVVHRYPDRVLFLATDFCSTYCRYCTRSRMVGRSSSPDQKRRWNKGIEYIRDNPVIRDVLISGGDPLTLEDSAIEYLLKNIRAIPHVEIIRIGTKVPMVLPQRITKELTRMLKKYHPLFMSIHCTHPDELTPESERALNRLADTGIPLGSQTVLLAGINDNVETMKGLVHGLLRNRVRPYYLYQCDQVPGSAHFRTSIEKGLSIIQGLRGHTSGYAVPHYVIDLPGGGGKTPLCPEYLQGREGDHLVFKNYEGRVFRAYDPVREGSR